MQTTVSTTLGDNTLIEQVIFTDQDISNIIEWFEERYEKHDGNIPNSERETYLKVAKYWKLNPQGMS